MSEYGIPYMGSKAGIISSIAMNFPKAEHFYDLFGGGFSVTHYMMMNKSHKYNNFHYNEINPITVELVKKAISGEYNYDTFKPEWISLGMFHARKETDAYVRFIWSFANNGKGYLFGEDIEQYKKSMHMAVVFSEFDALAKEVFGFNVWPSIAKTITQRRLYLRQKLDWYNKNKRIPKILYQFLSDKQIKEIGKKDNVKELEQLQQLEQLLRLEQLQRLQQLEKLQQLQQLQQLFITALDYRQVEILPNSVVYCDIPYAGTVEYANEFSHKDFFDWAASRDFPVFISEYDVPDKRFKLIYEVDKRSMFAANKETTVNKSEKLYWNQVS